MSRLPFPVVLMYHSISQPRGGGDLWGLQVSPRRFEAQIRALASAYDVITLADLATQMRTGHLRPNCVALTFDDGYANNATVAAPILRSAGVPATVFLCTGFIGAREFWWDRLAEIVFTATRPAADLRLALPEFADADRRLHDRNPAGVPAGPASVTDAAWQVLHRLPLERIEAALAVMADHFVPAGYGDGDDLRPMTATDVGRAARDFEIGAHSVTHPRLSMLGRHRQAWEIQQSEHDCEALTGRPVEWFSYPFGDFDEQAARIVSEHMQLACTTRPSAVVPGVSRFQVPRLQVLDWTPAELVAQLVTLSTIPPE